MSLTVKWGRERLYVPFPTPETKLAVVRDAVAELTSLPRDSFKLIHGGAVMKDDNAPISAFSLRPGSVIAVIGGNTGPLGPSKDRHSTKERPTEESVVGQIQAELSKVRNTIVPLLDTFLVNVGPSSAPTSSSAPSMSKTQSSTSQSTKSTATSSISTSPPTPPDLEQDHARLGELLLQCLLRLDLINMDGEWVEARKERKLAIKEVQSWLDKLDDAWKSRTLA